MSYEPINPAELGAVLSMIGTGAGWPTKGKIVGLVGSFEGGNWLTAPDVADFIGLSIGRTSVLLAQLEDERVLLRDGGDGGRIFWCEVNPDLARWRVPWKHQPREVRQKLAWYREQAESTVLERFIARPMHARCRDVIARLMSARSGPDGGPSSRGPGTRDDGGERGGSSRGQAARSGRSLRLVKDRAMSRGGQPKRGFVGGGEGDEAVGCWAGEGQSTTTVDPGQLARAKAAVQGRAVSAPGRRKFVNGRPLAQLEDLLRRHGVDAVLAAAGSAEVDQVPGLVEAMQIALDHPDLEHDGEHHAAEASRLERKRYLLQRLPVLDELLSAAPEDDVLLDERAECENELQALDEGVA